MVSTRTQMLIPQIQAYFRQQPIDKAWLFGSCSRGEEREDSDIDLLVSFDKDSHVTLMTMGGIYMDLKELLHRDIDLVEDGTLLPHAVESANRDKILIYERIS